jgi:hypothetical protein
MGTVNHFLGVKTVAFKVGVKKLQAIKANETNPQYSNTSWK